MSDYGTVEGVAAIASTWTLDGEFVDPDVYQSGSNPPLSTVEAWLETMSALMNAALKDNYFQTPILDPYPAPYPVSLAAVNQQCNILVADLVAARNQQGRFFLQTADVSRDLTNWAKIQKELIDWVKANAETFLAEGVPQITANSIRPGQTAVILGDDEFTDE